MSLGLGYMGPFRLLEIINRGQSCCLWKAYDDTKHEYVGIKTLLESTAKQRQQIKLLEHEYKVGSKFSHPNLIKIFHYDWQNRIPYFAMEWFPAVNLKQWINRGYESYCEHIPKIFTQSAQALNYQHKNGWVHRDVKPDNFLFAPDTAMLKMIDFALAKKATGGFLSRFMFKSAVQGTASYMAPEQIRGLSPIPAADIYGLACTFYELLTNRLVFTGDSLNDLLNKHLSATPPLVTQRNRNVTAEFSEVLKSMLAKRPDDRPKNTNEVIRLLQSTRIFRRTPSKEDIV